MPANAPLALLLPQPWNRWPASPASPPALPQERGPVTISNRARRDCRPGTTATAANQAGPARYAPHRAGRIRIGRRGVQVALGLLWLIDGALQLQPFMFSPKFSAQVLLPAGSGQPAWVSAVVGVFARQVAVHPAAWNAGFAAVQLALGACLLLPRLVRPALLASGLWAAGVWWLGEGFGGLWSGHASLITGAPGAVVLYAVLAAAAWPPPGRGEGRDRPGQPVAAWFPLAWLVIWLGGAWLQLLPGQNRPADLSAEISNSGGAPGWLAHAEALAASAAGHGGALLFTVVVTLMAAVGVTGWRPGRLRAASAAVGAGLALVFWMIGENFGELYSGHATDPGSGPLLVVMALALLGTTRRAAPGRPARARVLSALDAVSAFPRPHPGRTQTAVPAAGAHAHDARPHAAQSRPPGPRGPREPGRTGGIR